MHLGHETNKPGLCPSPEEEPQVIKPLQLIALKSHFGSLLWHYSGTTHFPPCFPSPLLSRSLEDSWGRLAAGQGCHSGVCAGGPGAAPAVLAQLPPGHQPDEPGSLAMPHPGSGASALPAPEEAFSRKLHCPADSHVLWINYAWIFDCKYGVERSAQAG